MPHMTAGAVACSWLTLAQCRGRNTQELADGWTVVTKDRSPSAQWEHMVAVTEAGYEVLTAWPGGTGSYPHCEVLVGSGSGPGQREWMSPAIAGQPVFMSLVPCHLPNSRVSS